MLEDKQKPAQILRQQTDFEQNDFENIYAPQNNSPADRREKLRAKVTARCRSILLNGKYESWSDLKKITLPCSRCMVLEMNHKLSPEEFEAVIEEYANRLEFVTLAYTCIPYKRNYEEECLNFRFRCKFHKPGVEKPSMCFSLRKEEFNRRNPESFDKLKNLALAATGEEVEEYQAKDTKKN